MALFIRPDSPYWWMLLDGHGRKKESTGIRHHAAAPAIKKALRAQAEEVYHARMVQLARAKVGLPIDTGQLFGPFSDWFETHHTAKHRSAARERVILTHLRAHFAAIPLVEIRPARWKEYETARLNDGVSLNTIGRELAVMKSILAAAVGEHLEVSPLAHTKRKTVRLPPKRTISADEEKRLIEALSPGTRRGGTFGADDELLDLYLVGVGTLLRQMNLITLKGRQYHASRLVVDTKTGPHAVTLSGPTVLQRRAALVLARRTPKTPNGVFFPKWHARFEKDRNGANAKLLQSFRRACARAGIPWGLTAHGVVWHTATRASGATRLLRDYHVDVRTVQLIGGWRSLDQMAEYLGVDLSAPAAVGKSGKRRSA